MPPRSPLSPRCFPATLALLGGLALPAGAQYGVIDQGQSLTSSTGGSSGQSTCTIQSPSPLTMVPSCAVDGDGRAYLTRVGGTATFQQASQVGGPVRAGVTLSVQNGTADGYTAIARSGFYDRYTVTGGAVSYLRFFVGADGIGSLTGDHAPALTPLSGGLIVYNFAELDAGASYASGGLIQRVAQSNQWLTTPNSGFQTGYVDVPVVGTSNSLLFRFFATVSILRPAGSTGGWSAQGESNFMNTFYLRGVAAYDAQGQDITDRVQISTSSGTVVTPEPSTGVLLAGALAGLGLLGRRRRRVA